MIALGLGLAPSLALAWAILHRVRRGAAPAMFPWRALALPLTLGALAAGVVILLVLFVPVARAAGHTPVLDALHIAMLEESAKAALFALGWWRWPPQRRQPVAAGAALGIGFALIENALYLAPAAVTGSAAHEVGVGAFSRALFGVGAHTCYGLCLGAAVALARARRGPWQRAALAAAVLGPVALHTVWDALLLTARAHPTAFDARLFGPGLLVLLAGIACVTGRLAAAAIRLQRPPALRLVPAAPTGDSLPSSGAPLSRRHVQSVRAASVTEREAS